jgi:hypothetical protein
MEGSSIDELWTTSSPNRNQRSSEGGDDSNDEFFHNAQETISAPSNSEERTSEGLELACIYSKDICCNLSTSISAELDHVTRDRDVIMECYAQFECSAPKKKIRVP